MRWSALVLLLQACGRLGFDASTDAGRDLGTESGADSGTAGDGAQPAALIIQERTGSALTGTPLIVSLAPPTAGHFLLMVGAANSGNLTGVTGGGVVNWSMAAKSTTRANIEIWYGVTDGSASQIAIHRTGNTNDIWMNVSEWSGLLPSNVLDAADAQTGMSSPANAPLIAATTAPVLLIFGVGIHVPNTFGAPSPGTWTPLASASTVAFTQSAWYQVAPAIGSHQPQVTETDHRWDAAIAAFRATP